MSVSEPQSVAEFRILLVETLNIARNFAAASPSYEVYQVILRQLEAMRDWTSGGRTPDGKQRESIDIGLIAVRELDISPDLAVDDLSDRLQVLNYAFDEWDNLK